MARYFEDGYLYMQPKTFSMKGTAGQLSMTRWFIPVIFFLIASCHKESSPSGPPDSNGTTLDKQVYSDSLSTSSSAIQYTYNSSGDLFSIRAGSYPSGDTLIYSASGKLLKYKVGNFYESTMVYDSTGRIVGKSAISLSQNNTFNRTSYAYDNLGRIIADSTKDTSRVIMYHTYSYDTSNNIVKYQQFSWFNNSYYSTSGEGTVNC